MFSSQSAKSPDGPVGGNSDKSSRLDGDPRLPETGVIELTIALFRSLATADSSNLELLYDVDAEFRNPVVGMLKGADIAKAWQSFFEKTPDFQLGFEVIRLLNQTATVRWQASYSFLPTGRPVRHDGQSVVVFRGQRVILQTDTFSLGDWTPQAVGPAGHVLHLLPGARSWIAREVRHGYSIGTPHLD